MKKGDDTRERIIVAGLTAARNGLHEVKARGISNAVHISHTGLFYYFETIEDLRDAIAREAIIRKDQAVIARLIVDKHPLAALLSAGERAAALATL